MGGRKTFGLVMRIMRGERVSRHGDIAGELAIVRLVMSMAVVTPVEHMFEFRKIYDLAWHAEVSPFSSASEPY